MFCPKCGKEFEESVKFCSNCGTKLEQEEAQEVPKTEDLPVEPVNQSSSETVEPLIKEPQEADIRDSLDSVQENSHISLLEKIKNKFSKKTWIKIIVCAAVTVLIIVICAVVFHKPNPDKVVISKDSVTVGLKEAPTIPLKVTPENASSSSFQLISGDSKIVTFTVGETGGTYFAKVNPVSAGSTTLKVNYTSSSGKVQSSNNITVTIIDKDAQKKQADAVIKQIDSLANVTISDYDKVQNIDSEYKSLPEYAKNLVKNTNKLYKAEEDIERQAETKAAPIIKEINSIGKVTKDSAAKIKSIRSEFNALYTIIQTKVTNESTLKDAESSLYTILAQPVIQAINNIGTVTKDSAAKINAARTQYDTLSDDAKKAVSNYSTLESAESDLQSIQAAAQEAAAKAKEVSDYKNSCGTYSYKEIARNPDTYSGKNAKFTGKVIQVMNDYSGVVLRVSVTKDEYGIWNDVVYVTYTYPESSSPKILENDIITMYGELSGSETYTSTLGASITIPAFDAKYIDIQ